MGVSSAWHNDQERKKIPKKKESDLKPRIKCEGGQFESGGGKTREPRKKYRRKKDCPVVLSKEWEKSIKTDNGEVS